MRRTFPKTANGEGIGVRGPWISLRWFQIGTNGRSPYEGHSHVETGCYFLIIRLPNLDTEGKPYWFSQ